MSKKSPTYTFQRPRKQAAFPQNEIQTEVKYDDFNTAEHDPYVKYTFWLVLIILFVLVGGGGYVYYKGIPVKLRG